MRSYDYRNTIEFMRNMVPFLDGSNPFIYKQNVDLGDLSLIGYSQTSTLPLLGGGIKKNTKTVHFFLDDYRFEEVWSTPEKYIKKLKQYKQVLGPDFSAYTQMPLELQRWNIFRGKWCCAYWQQQGLAVIPTVNWAGQNTYDWAFDGIEQGSIVALSTVGCYYVEDDFMQGFKEMVNRIKPDRVVNYGKNFDGMEELVDTVQVPYNFLKSDYNDDDFFKLDEDYKFVGEST